MTDDERNEVLPPLRLSFAPISGYAENTNGVTPVAPEPEVEPEKTETQQAWTPQPALPGIPEPDLSDPDATVTCPECGHGIKASNMRAHRRKSHNVGRLREFKPRVAKEFKCDQCDKTFDRPDKLARHIPAAHRPRKPRRPKPIIDMRQRPEVLPVVAPGDEALTVDGIVHTLIELRWPQMMPTQKVFEMDELKAVLEKFLA
jgi:uncharacterized C2H2 Zn-finger protein